jgi:hypothetical protein
MEVTYIFHIFIIPPIWSSIRHILKCQIISDVGLLNRYFQHIFCQLCFLSILIRAFFSSNISILYTCYYFLLVNFSFLKMILKYFALTYCQCILYYIFSYVYSNMHICAPVFIYIYCFLTTVLITLTQRI